MLDGLRSRRARMVDDAQLRGESLRLVPPVENERLGRDNQRRLPAGCPQCIEKCQYLDRFPKTHIVCETPAESEFAKEFQPAQSFSLILAQLAGKTLFCV